MTDVWLAIIALAVFVMAAIQVGLIVYGWRVARRIDRVLTQVERLASSEFAASFASSSGPSARMIRSGDATVVVEGNHYFPPESVERLFGLDILGTLNLNVIDPAGVPRVMSLAEALEVDAHAIDAGRVEINLEAGAVGSDFRESRRGPRRGWR